MIKAILVDVIDPETDMLEAENRLLELESLVGTYGGVVVIKMIQKRGTPDYATYIGKGKIEELFEEAKEKEVEILVINNLLKPRQLYSLEEKFREIGVKVWDRVDMILKIFDKHAKSTEAKLQIELASIKHMGARIYNMGIELSRQAGAVGLRAGQGESNTEMMKRHLRDQELNIEKKLKHYELIHEGHRKRRRRNNFKTVALVGYTNAGKSSILHALTGKDVYIADQLFATLDTRVGKIYISAEDTVSSNSGKPPHHADKPDQQHKPAHEYKPGKEILVSDTIGFIQDLPPGLIKAFKSTLAETVDADVILHVIDIADPQIEMKIEVVEDILKQLGADKKKKIYIFNKTDLIDKSVFEEQPEPLPRPYPGVVAAGRGASKELGWKEDEEYIEEQSKKVVDPKHLEKKYKKYTPVFVSAHSKQNLDALIKEIDKQTE